MSTGANDDGRYHVLLIGIDAYPDEAQLTGCVNDIDGIQGILVDRARIPLDHIVRLASPHPGSRHDVRVAEQPATLANIRAALADLGSERVGPSDRVFIYYAGHGTRLPVTIGERRLQREALVPVDATLAGPNVLFDFELNALLAGIAARTSAVAFVLDCCQSAGATRAIRAPGARTRYVDLGSTLGPSGSVTLSSEQRDQLDRLEGQATTRGVSRGVVAGVVAGVAGSVEDCQVLAGCLSHEQVQEKPLDGVQHGLLTYGLLTVMGDVPDGELRTTSWGRIWNRLRSSIESENPMQHLWMSGGLARAWLAGPPANGDPGLGIGRRGDDYVIDAGTVAGVTVGARLAVYGERPATFPPLGSADDVAARHGDVLLDVVSATVSEAIARAPGEPFDLPDAARARLVRPGEAERLTCAVVPEDPAIAEALSGSELLRVTAEREAVARLEQRSDGSWDLVDDVHGVHPGDPVLCTLAPDAVAGLARGVVEHYVRYAAPIRMARRCTDLPGALQVSLLECPPTGKVAPDAAPMLPEIPTQPDSSYELMAGDRLGIRVHNASHERLQVTLFDSLATGAVALLAKGATVDAGHDEIFWLNSEIGQPFTAGMTPPDADVCIDRVVAIGTTALDADLGHLQEARGWPADATRGLGGDTGSPPAPPADRWTATEILLRTRRP